VQFLITFIKFNWLSVYCRT